MLIKYNFCLSNSSNDDQGKKSSFVYTLLFNERWHTLSSFRGNSIGDFSTTSMYSAGQNHLTAALDLKKRIGDNPLE
jgi:hypothetical protein